jgi:HSP20 family molecular chaperone IbpA
MEGSALHAMIPLPEGTDREKIEAIYKDGLLMVRIPKKRLGAGRKIPLKPA